MSDDAPKAPAGNPLEPVIDLRRPPVMHALALTERASAYPRREVCVDNDALPRAYVRWLGPGFVFQATRPYQIEELGRTIRVPAGFRFDAASVPRIVWSLISPTDLGVVAPLVHDWLYRTGGQDGEFSRREADRLFKAHMRSEGVADWKVRLAYTAVRAFGRRSWRG